MKKIIFFITIFLIAISNPLAETKTLIKDRIEDTYTYYYDKTLGRERYIYASKYIFDNNIAYCLELGKLLESNIYTYTTSFEEININQNVLNEIKKIAYYGYDYPGHNTDKYYMATQEMIWDKLEENNVVWVKDMNPNNQIDIEKEKNEIEKLYNTHEKKPSFDNQEIEYTLGDILVIEDTNGFLDRYITTTKNVIIEGNKLILTEDFSEKEVILKHPNYTGNQFLLYTSGASQKMMSVGGITDVSSTLKIKLTGGSIELNKLDEDNKNNTSQGEATLNGAVYELYDDEGSLVETLITGKNNRIDNLPIGIYTLKEIIPSEGYMLDENTYTIEITKENLNVNLDVYEKVITRRIDLFKVFAANTTGELTPEIGIIFEVYDKNNNLIETLITDRDGHTNITLPYGTYTFKQITTTENYYKVEDFNITISEYNEKPIYKLLSNSEITAKVKIIKKDFDTKENIINSSIKFKIFNVKEGKYVSQKVSYPETKLTEEFQVDKNGIFITPEELPPGEYILEELQESMYGYLYNSEKITFTIGETSNFIEEDGDLLLEVPFYNKKVKGIINIIKYGEEIRYTNNTYYYKKIPLSGVVLNLYAKEDIYDNGKIIYRKDELVKEIITDEYGTSQIKDMPLGKYYLKEISTTNNHIIDESTYDIFLKYKDQYTDTITTNVEINNYLPKGELIINKYETGTNNRIKDTLIEVRTKDNIVVYKGYTNQNGQITIEDLPYGEYYISEIEASTGYRLLEDKIIFEITKDKEEINIYNERIKVPNTGFTLVPVDIFVIIATFLGIILIVFFHKEKRVVLLSMIIILLGITYLIITIYKYHTDYQETQKSIEAYINNNIETVTEEKYQYKSVLEIPAINLKRGILDINNEYNNAKYNIELIKENDTIIVVAAHNGNYRNSYFGNLHNIELGDEIKYYKDGTLSTYIYSESYDIKKNGYADIYRKEDIKSIILITCKDNTDDAQTVYIGYLKEESIY